MMNKEPVKGLCEMKKPHLSHELLRNVGTDEASSTANANLQLAINQLFRMISEELLYYSAHRRHDHR